MAKTSIDRAPRNLFDKNPRPLDISFERGLPAALDAERTILGSILMEDVTLYADDLDGLTRDDFALDAHRRIFEAMNYLSSEDIRIDMITLSNELEVRQEIEIVGGVAYLSSLLDGLPDRPSIAEYVKIVKDRAMLRGLIGIAQNAIAQAVEQSVKPLKLITNVQEAILELRLDAPSQRAVRIQDSFPATITKLRERATASKDRTAIGLTFGNAKLDASTTGMWPGEVTILAGHTKDGKTSEAIKATLANLKEGTPVLYISHESDRDTLNLRMIAQETTVSFAKLREGRHLHSGDWEAIEAAQQWIPKLPLYVIDADEMPLHMIVSMGKLHARRDNVKLIVIDFLQQVDAPGGSQLEAINNASRGLCKLAKAEKIHLLVLSQLTNPDNRDKTKVKPNWRMIRGSGNLAMDAHIVLAVWRPEEDGRLTGKDEILIMLQRSGPAGVHIDMEYNEERLMYVPRGWGNESNQGEMYV